ncbi:HTH-type transcriptional repressor of iron proteins A [Serratia rubidaea]|uniref:Arabinose operon regulatory protein n=1 Tax=Serratia rubidaea TaxID=61652 RepID=A0A4U9HTH9_SERRU|nr:helix-turn-helix transcriptional regulator [Serratia rubidaea]MBS0973394.1 helix-turn-helix transcriptional regulator [Serratia rubidaea]MCR0997729.1 helix-turn-helix transcriptional regulator [Serratia rubidaea]MDC6109239.1 helix-turn-helix transcriptional regulator [Serratia rubidaea]MDK1705213.1 helix-turn-helix transcriptional regulator [Serratia rubidaea]QPR64363.1 helix-turn-helix transcriptional regulator [Serratia rubidaea]
MSLLQSYEEFDPDANASQAVALHISATETRRDMPFHHHRKGQLILPLRGGLVCEVAKAYWMVPTGHAVWIPGGMEHSNRAMGDVDIYLLFVEPDYPGMPDECCTLQISPMLREIIKHFATLPEDYAADSPTGRLAAVMMHELAQMPVEHLHVPISGNAKIKQLADEIMLAPGSRSTLHEWAQKLAMSDRSFERFIRRETGMTFGKWRHQLQLMVAVRMLVLGESVQNVAYELGYDSPTAFITMFKKALGKTPGRYLLQD